MEFVYYKFVFTIKFQIFPKLTRVIRANYCLNESQEEQDIKSFFPFLRESADSQLPFEKFSPFSTLNFITVSNASCYAGGNRQ